MNRICNRYNKRFSLNAFIKDQIFITFTEETMDSANRKLKTSSRWSGLCLSLNFASFSSSGHVCDFDDTIRSTNCKRLMWWWKCALIYIYTKKCARASAQPRSRDLGIWPISTLAWSCGRARFKITAYQHAPRLDFGRARASKLLLFSLIFAA